MEVGTRYELPSSEVLVRAVAPRVVRALELERRKRLYPWPEKVGIDEHLSSMISG